MSLDKFIVGLSLSLLILKVPDTQESSPDKNRPMSSRLTEIVGTAVLSPSGKRLSSV